MTPQLMVQYVKDHLEGLPQWAKIGVGIACASLPVAIVLLRKPRKSPVKSDWKKDVIYLYQFGRSPAIPNLSPFCLKVELWARMVGLQGQLEIVDNDMWIRSKEGKLPFVEVNGKEICDSSFIIRDLGKIFHKDAIENDMSSEMKGAARAIEQMTEGSLLSSYAYVRYGDHAAELLSAKVMGPVPWIVRTLAPWYLARKVRAALAIQGIGLHERHEVINIGLDDLKAISNFLGPKRFITGDSPTRVDATVFSIVAQIIYLPIDTEHRRFVEAECHNLMEYCDRIKAQYYPDWDQLYAAKK